MLKSKTDFAGTVIEVLANREGVPAEEVAREIQEAIDQAWASNDPMVKARQAILFPGGKPDPETFLKAFLQNFP